MDGNILNFYRISKKLQMARVKFSQKFDLIRSLFQAVQRIHTFELMTFFLLPKCNSKKKSLDKTKNVSMKIFVLFFFIRLINKLVLDFLYLEITWALLLFYFLNTSVNHHRRKCSMLFSPLSRTKWSHNISWRDDMSEKKTVIPENDDNICYIVSLSNW